MNGLGRANIVHNNESESSFSHNFNCSASEEFGGFVVNEIRVLKVCIFMGSIVKRLRSDLNSHCGVQKQLYQGLERNGFQP